MGTTNGDRRPAPADRKPGSRPSSFQKIMGVVVPGLFALAVTIGIDVRDRGRANSQRLDVVEIRLEGYCARIDTLTAKVHNHEVTQALRGDHVRLEILEAAVEDCNQQLRTRN